MKPQISLIKVIKCTANTTALGLADISTSQLVFYRARVGVKYGGTNGYVKQGAQI